MVLSIPDLQLGVLSRFPIPLPSLSEQANICERMKQTRKAVAAEQQRLEKWKTMKNGLMHDLLTGRVRVKLDA
jgi:type I restriction enzyme S subunit